MKNIFQKIKELRLERYSVWAIVLLAALIRFKGLVRRDFWYDEAFTGVAVKENFHDMINMIINDVHPPLYYLTLKIFSSFFNYSVYGIRLFSAIFGVLSVWALYILAKELFNVKVARYAALVAAISPFAIQYSQEARMYAVLVFFILIAAYFFVKGLRTGKAKYYVFWGIFTGLSMLVHYMGIIFSLLYYAVFVIWRIYEANTDSIVSAQNKVKEFFKKIIPSKNLVLGYGVAFLVFLPWLKIFIRHFLMKGTNLSWVKPASLGDIIIAIQMFLFGTPLGEMSSGMPQPNELRGIAHISIRMAIAMLLIAGIIYLLRRERREKTISVLLFSVGFMFIIYLLSATLPDQQYFVARYMLPGAFFIFIFIGLWLSHIKLRYNIVIFGAYLFLLSLIIPLNNSQGYNMMIMNMSKYKNNNFYILNSFDYVISKYYLGENRLTLYNYDWPEYNPSYWAAIGPGLKRTENYEDLRNDPNALIISNKVLNKDNQYFSTEGLELVDQYKNILIYKFEK
jgi:uncharacterized membrane protein